jgi:hypothetical protein
MYAVHFTFLALGSVCLEREKSEENMKEEKSGEKIGVFYRLVGELRQGKIKRKVVGVQAHKKFGERKE